MSIANLRTELQLFRDEGGNGGHQHVSHKKRVLDDLESQNEGLESSIQILEDRLRDLVAQVQEFTEPLQVFNIVITHYASTWRSSSFCCQCFFTFVHVLRICKRLLDAALMIRPFKSIISLQPSLCYLSVSFVWGPSNNEWSNLSKCGHHY